MDYKKWKRCFDEVEASAKGESRRTNMALYKDLLCKILNTMKMEEAFFVDHGKNTTMETWLYRIKHFSNNKLCIRSSDNSHMIDADYLLKTRDGNYFGVAIMQKTPIGYLRYDQDRRLVRSTYVKRGTKMFTWDRNTSNIINAIRSYNSHVGWRDQIVDFYDLVSRRFSSKKDLECIVPHKPDESSKDTYKSKPIKKGPSFSKKTNKPRSKKKSNPNANISHSAKGGKYGMKKDPVTGLYKYPKSK